MLDGDGLNLVSVAIDGVPLPQGRLCRDARPADDLAAPPGPFRLDIETLVDPPPIPSSRAFTARAGSIAPNARRKAFRRITYFPDRPT
jgi:aminopeptidase N